MESSRPVTMARRSGCTREADITDVTAGRASCVVILPISLWAFCRRWRGRIATLTMDVLPCFGAPMSTSAAIMCRRRPNYRLARGPRAGASRGPSVVGGYSPVDAPGDLDDADGPEPVVGDGFAVECAGEFVESAAGWAPPALRRCRASTTPAPRNAECARRTRSPTKNARLGAAERSHGRSRLRSSTTRGQFSACASLPITTGVALRVPVSISLMRLTDTPHAAASCVLVSPA